MTDDAQSGVLSHLKGLLAPVVGALSPLGLALLGVDPATAALAGVMAQEGTTAVLGSVGRAAKAKAEAAGRELFIEIKARLDATSDPHQQRRIVEEYAADPRRDDILLEGWKVLFSAPDPAVWPVLRRLAIDYWSAARSPDAFFRDVSAMLAACVAEDIEAIRFLLQRNFSLHAHREPGTGEYELNYNAGDNANLTVTSPNDVGIQQVAIQVNPRRAMALLGANQLARNTGDRVTFRRDDRERTEALRRLFL